MDRCTGLFGPCSAPVTNYLRDPDGKDPDVPFCKEHWEFAENLTELLKKDQDFAKKFEVAMAKVTMANTKDSGEA